MGCFVSKDANNPDNRDATSKKKDHESPSRPEGESAAFAAQPQPSQSSLHYFDAAMSESDFNSLPVTERESMAETIFYDTRQSSITDYPPALLADPHPAGSIRMDKPSSLLSNGERSKRSLKNTLLLRRQLDSPPSSLGLKGYPGELTKEELEQCLNFRRQLKSGPKTYRDMVYCFQEVEEEAYALCRCLRARKFDPEAVLSMMGDHVAVFQDAQANNFYSDIDMALGCPLNVFLTQVPFFYSGKDKSGCSIIYFLVGQFSAEGLDCLTNPEETIVKYVWYAMKHGLEKAVRKGKGTRCEVQLIVDLKGLSASTINRRTLGLLKSIKPAVLSFPEILNRIIIFNAPTFFAFSWTIIRPFLDPRTQKKVEIHSGDAADRLYRLVDRQVLLKDVGGDGLTFEEALLKDGGGSREIVHRLKLSYGKYSEVNFALSAEEDADVTVYTKSKGSVAVKGTKVEPTAVEVASPKNGPGQPHLIRQVKGPGSFSVNVKCAAKSTGYFVVVAHVSRNKTRP